MSKTKPEVIIWPPALRDMEDIFSYIQADNPIAADALLREFHEKIAALADHPKLYRRGRVQGTREMVVRYSYVVVYKETPRAITVLRVLHTARQWP
jgi:addiction module RelE/StbE family toxin